MATSVRDAILDALVALPPGASLGIEDLSSAVDERLQRKHGRLSEVRARLFDLLRDGVVERVERGQYRIPRSERDLTVLERRLSALLRRTWRPAALAHLVLWDATPFLDLSEDGAPGQRIVVEHPDAASLAETISYAWDVPPVLWTTRGRGPLDDRLLLPDRLAPRIDLGVVLVAQERLGGTTLIQDGFRVPTLERIAVEFMGLDARPEVGAAVTEALLLRSDLDYGRLVEAANALGSRSNLIAVLTACYDRLPPNLRESFRKRLPSVAVELMGLKS